MTKIKPYYTQAYLDSRLEIASDALVCKAANLANKWRFGSINMIEQKKLELCLAQLDCIKTFSIIEKPAFATITVTGDGGLDVDTVIKINSVTISDPFRFDTDVETTAAAIVDAINNYTSNYSATRVGADIIITAVTPGDTPNGYAITQVGGDVTFSLEYMHDGQDGVESNNLTEDQLDHMFENIAAFANCCYKNTFNGMSSIIPSTNVITTLNSGAALQYNTLEYVRLNTYQLVTL